jgi:hypothetical protein
MMDSHRISSDELKIKQAAQLVFEICGNPMEPDGINYLVETPKPLFQNRDLYGIAIRLSVITNC